MRLSAWKNASHSRRVAPSSRRPRKKSCAEIALIADGDRGATHSVRQRADHPSSDGHLEELEDVLRRQSVAAAADARGRGLPRGLRPAPLLHAVEQGVQRGEREPQGAVAFLFDTAGNLVAVERLLFKYRQYRQLRTASLDRRVHRCHRDPMYSVPIYASQDAHCSEMRRPSRSMWLGIAEPCC